MDYLKFRTPTNRNGNCHSLEINLKKQEYSLDKHYVGSDFTSVSKKSFQTILAVVKCAGYKEV